MPFSRNLCLKRLKGFNTAGFFRRNPASDICIDGPSYTSNIHSKSWYIHKSINNPVFFRFSTGFPSFAWFSHGFLAAPAPGGASAPEAVAPPALPGRSSRGAVPGTSLGFNGMHLGWIMTRLMQFIPSRIYLGFHGIALIMTCLMGCWTLIMLNGLLKPYHKSPIWEWSLHPIHGDSGECLLFF